MNNELITIDDVLVRLDGDWSFYLAIEEDRILLILPSEY
jgi:hypothetical protein